MTVEVKPLMFRNLAAPKLVPFIGGLLAPDVAAHCHGSSTRNAHNEVLWITTSTILSGRRKWVCRTNFAWRANLLLIGVFDVDLNCESSPFKEAMQFESQVALNPHDRTFNISVSALSEPIEIVYFVPANDCPIPDRTYEAPTMLKDCAGRTHC